MSDSYFIVGSPFKGDREDCSESQAKALDNVISEFWGDGRDSQITIEIQCKPQSQRCTEVVPQCWSRVHNPNAPCTCGGFEGGQKIVIRRDTKRRGPKFPNAKRRLRAPARYRNPPDAVVFL